MSLLRIIDGFFFKKIPANAFGMMRIVWAGITMLYLLFQCKDVAYYYSEEGIYPHYIETLYSRSHLRFTLLDYVDQPLAVHCLYLILIVLLFCTMIGLRTRMATVLSVLLLFSFHERNGFILGGGDTLLRIIGFILMIAPGITALSIDRAARGLNEWKNNRTFPPPVTMPIWPWRLLLWQMIILYATSTWTKLLGSMWLTGTAIQSTLHHPLFARWPFWLTDLTMPILPLVDRLTLLFQFLWIFLLIPAVITRHLPRFIPRIPLRRILIGTGILFHGSIFILMDAGVFSLAVFVAYIGLLREEDILWLKKVMSYESRVMSTYNSQLTTSCSTVVLFDGDCGLCLRSMYSLLLCDWLHILKPVNFRIVDDHRAFAPDITERNLDKAMHIRLADDTYLTGFDAFRHLSGKLPPLWLLYPLLWIPGVSVIGRMAYTRIADSRKKCNHENCRI